MSFKGFVILAVVVIAIYSYYGIQKNNPLSVESVKERQEEYVSDGGYGVPVKEKKD